MIERLVYGGDCRIWLHSPVAPVQTWVLRVQKHVVGPAGSLILFLFVRFWRDQEKIEDAEDGFEFELLYL